MFTLQVGQAAATGDSVCAPKHTEFSSVLATCIVITLFIVIVIVFLVYLQSLTYQVGYRSGQTFNFTVIAKYHLNGSSYQRQKNVF